MSLNLQLKKLRGDRSQKEIADALGINQPTYNRYERGDREPDIATIIRISEYYNVSTDELLGAKKNVSSHNLRAELAEAKLAALKKALAALLKEY